MSSQNALAPNTGNAAGWQVDISSLTSLMLSLGTAGLKELTLAGVDLNIIGYMWKIAEGCPASNDYRREISVRRQDQRSHSIWLYKIVEIGAATNFVVDEFLKNRAGENVVALMSAILPVMSEKASDTLLLHLFEASGVPFEFTPSFGQLRSIRVTLESIARKMSFQDKVFQHHVWMKSLLESSTEKESYYDSIPNEESSTFVIRILGKLISDNNSASTVTYYGFKGAAWVATYARYMLGLPVCVLRTTSDVIPLSGTYKESRVRLYIYNEKDRCEVHVEGKLEQFLVPNSLGLNDRARWSIDTDMVDLLTAMFPDFIDLQSSLSAFVGSLAYDSTEILAKSLCRDQGRVETRNPQTVNLLKYPVYCLPALKQRTRRVLQRFGIDPRESRDTKQGLWRDYISEVPTNESYSYYPRWPSMA